MFKVHIGNFFEFSFMLEVSLFCSLLFLSSLLLRSQTINIATSQKHGFKTKYIIYLLISILYPFIGFVGAFFILIITMAETFAIREKQTNKFIIFLCYNKVIDFFNKLNKMLNKPIWKKVEEIENSEEDEEEVEND